jgi:hypothetical protein
VGTVIVGLSHVIFGIPDDKIVKLIAIFVAFRLLPDLSMSDIQLLLLYYLNSIPFTNDLA